MMKRVVPNEATAEAALSFSAAMEELESILGRIEAEEIDIDDLARELGRASELIELARGKIKKAELEVAQIVAGLDAASGDKASG